ncbi:MAG: lytic transglycosylase domain-containing protein [Thermoanaerobaculia bacterium]|nr:lytic transglycosylase domain-containing protein [Thermoanaerobaculia bacterium]
MSSRRWHLRTWSLLGAILLASGSPSAAELAILRGGHVLKVSEYEVDDDKARLVLLGGGTMTVPMMNVVRILDDEIEIVDERLAEVADPGLVLVFRPGQEPPSTPYGELIFAAAERHGLNPDLVAAMVRVESAFQPAVVSPKGARGLMQLMPATASRFGVAVHELANPERNLEAGTSYLEWLLRRFGEDPSRVLAAYNAGEGSVDRYGGVPPYRETQNYLKRIYAILGVDPSAQASSQEGR